MGECAPCFFTGNYVQSAKRHDVDFFDAWATLAATPARATIRSHLGTLVNPPLGGLGTAWDFHRIRTHVQPRQ
jgi:hypothetical protein